MALVQVRTESPWVELSESLPTRALSLPWWGGDTQHSSHTPEAKVWIGTPLKPHATPVH
jgi:hypothetical protein